MQASQSMELLDQICEEFERVLSRGESPSISEYLEKAPESVRHRLALLLVGIEVEHLRKQGREVRFEDYERAYSITQAEWSSATRKRVDQWLEPSPGAEVGALFGSYRLLTKLGEGGMGVVYLAKNVLLNKLVAIKVMSQSSQAGNLGEQYAKKITARFRREIAILGKLSHPNIAMALDAGIHQTDPYLVMEYVDGVDGSRMLKICGPLRVSDACEIIRQACEGIQHAYEAGIVHRDLKPANLMISRGGEVKILDLGLGKAIDSEDTQLTELHSVPGTADYIAPEQWKSGAVTIASDIYSLGCTLYCLLAGRPPFADGEPLPHLLKGARHLYSEADGVRQSRPDVSEELERVIRRAIAKDPEERFATPRDFAESLKPFIGQVRLRRMVQYTLCDFVDASISQETLRVAGENTIGDQATVLPDAMESRTMPVAASPLSSDSDIRAVMKPLGNTRVLGIAAAAILTGLIVVWMVMPGMMKEDPPKIVGSAEVVPSPTMEKVVVRPPVIQEFRLKILPPQGDASNMESPWVGEVEALPGDRIAPVLSLDSDGFLYYIAMTPKKELSVKVILPSKGKQTRWSEIAKPGESRVELNDKLWQLDEGLGHYCFVMFVSPEPFEQLEDLVRSLEQIEFGDEARFEGCWAVDESHIGWLREETRGLVEPPVELAELQSKLLSFREAHNISFRAVSFWLE